MWKMKQRNYIIAFFSITNLFTKNKLWTSTIHLAIFLSTMGWQCLSTMNTIASHNQFKSIGIGENLVVNYNIL